MAKMKDIVIASQDNNKAELYESSLGRIWQQVQDAENKSFAIITSWRQNHSRKKNLQDIADLKKSVRGLGLGFIAVQGHWQECQDPDVAYADCPRDQLVDASEPSLFVTGISKNDLVRLGNKHQQDAVVFAGPETKGRVVLLFGDGTSQDIGDFKPQTMGQAFTELRKSKESPGSPRTFKFEGLEYRPQNFIESLIEQEVKKLVKQHLDDDKQ